MTPTTKIYFGDRDMLINYYIDNPSTLDWVAISETLESYNAGGDFAVIYKFSFVTKKSERMVISDVHANIIIVEGIFV